MPKHEEDYTVICGFREGATFCKMDLHTHTPASECSSFTLPAALEGVFKRGKGTSWKSIKPSYEFVKSLASGKDYIKTEYESAASTVVSIDAKRPGPDAGALMRIAGVWLNDIRAFFPDDGKTPGKDDVGRITDCLTPALRDIRNYLRSLFFPEQYVLRCLIEGIQLSAITDHNHPGYIVPRISELGTWHSAVQRINDVYAAEIGRGDPDNRVRDTVIKRLQIAEERILHGFDEKSNVGQDVKNQHPDLKKKLGKNQARFDHIQERLAYWQDTANKIQPLIVLPGTEITTSNVHLLAVFPPDWFVSGRIGYILRAIGIDEDQWGCGFVAAASASVQETISMVDREGGLVIPAHSNSDFKGLLRLFPKGLALNKVMAHPALLALETIGGTVKAGEGKKPGLNACETLKWLDTGSNRPDRAKPICFVKGSDAHEVRIELDGTGEDIGARFTYIKMDIRPNDTTAEVFRSLRLALLSGQSRIVEYPFEDGYIYTAPKNCAYCLNKKDRTRLLDCNDSRPTIIGMTVRGKGAYTDGLMLRFNPYLNCVVGSGGKSTLVRTLGYAFGLQGFMPGTKASWLPEETRVFWRYGECVYCIERIGRKADPAEAEVRKLERTTGGAWNEVAGAGADPGVVIWPPHEIQDGKKGLSTFEDGLIDDLVEHLRFSTLDSAGPILINQPKDVFNNKRLFESVLARPYLKHRQIIWSTGSPNVPTALDAEKIIVTEEVQKGKKMQLACAGDLHEDEVREKLLTMFEGGALAFSKRVTLYSL